MVGPDSFSWVYLAGFSVPTFAYILRISLDAGIGIRLGFDFLTVYCDTTIACCAVLSVKRDMITIGSDTAAVAAYYVDIRYAVLCCA